MSITWGRGCAMTKMSNCGDKKLVMVLVLMFTWSFLYAEHIQLSFDDPFPMSWYKKAFNTGMQVWGDLEMLQENVYIGKEECELLLDTTTGRLVYLHICLENMIDSDRVVLADDVTYVVNIINKIELVCIDSIRHERMLSVHRVVKQIKDFLHNNFQA